MYHIFVIFALALTLSGCAARLGPPVVQAWTAILLRDQTVVHVEAVTQLFPVFTLRQCRQRDGLSYVAWQPCAQRVFRFVTLDMRKRVATYRELQP